MILNKLSNILIKENDKKIEATSKTTKLILNFIQKNITIQREFLNNKTLMIINQIYILITKKLINEKK